MVTITQLSGVIVLAEKLIQIVRNFFFNCETGITSINNAWEGKMTVVDAYIFPRPVAGHGDHQVKEVVDHLKDTKYGMLWLDIEGPQYWMKSKSDNQAFLEQMLSACNDTNTTCGIYTSKSQWEPIMGLDYHQNSFPLWYAHYDNKPNFDDYVEFSGWTKPFMKQYKGDITYCGCGSENLDYNWRP